MHRNARQLQNLINQLLDLSRLEAGTMQLQVEQGDIIAFVKPLLYGYTSLAESKSISYTISFEQESLLTEFDPDKLEKIINNLLSNAFKFTPDNGEIHVSISTSQSNINTKVKGSKPEQVIKITVRDTGIGIAADQIQHIFNRFYQIDHSFTREYEGSGIGLAFAKELTELHGGQILVSSKKEEGTTFTLLLPLVLGSPNENTVKINGSATIQDAFLPQIDPQERVASQTSLSVILVVEDNSDLRNYIRQSLHPYYHVLEAGNGLEGMQIALKHIPDLIITDLMMPKMEGNEFCHKLKTDERTSHIPVIMLTARADQSSKLQGLKKGADDYIPKPFDVQELQVRIANLIEGRRRLKVHFQRILMLQPAEIQINSAEEEFLAKVMKVIEKYLSASGFDVDTFAKEIGMSRSQFYRKIAALTGKSPNEFIRDMRLKRAAQLLALNRGTVAEIAYEVGFNRPSYFTKCFKDYYGKLPSEYTNQIENKP
jgi:CheY-like chemotaxis protein/AraC-like DNA-binding protein